MIHQAQGTRTRGTELLCTSSQGTFQQLHQVVDLLQLASGVLIELTLTRQDMKRLQQFNRLPTHESVKIGLRVLGNALDRF